MYFTIFEILTWNDRPFYTLGNLNEDHAYGRWGGGGGGVGGAKGGAWGGGGGSVHSRHDLKQKQNKKDTTRNRQIKPKHEQLTVLISAQ